MALYTTKGEEIESIQERPDRPDRLKIGRKIVLFHCILLDYCGIFPMPRCFFLLGFFKLNRLPIYFTCKF